MTREEIEGSSEWERAGSDSAETGVDYVVIVGNSALPIEYGECSLASGPDSKWLKARFLIHQGCPVYRRKPKPEPLTAVVTGICRPTQMVGHDCRDITVRLPEPFAYLINGKQVEITIREIQE